MAAVIVFAGGEAPDPRVLEDLPEAALAVAADGGYDVAATVGHPIDVVVGDLDSLQTLELPRHVLVERHSPDKDATDLELALDLVLRDRPERVVVVGGTGGRQDHELATATLLCSTRYEGIEEIDWISVRGQAHVVRRHRIIHADVGATISLIPFHGDAVGVVTSGLRWNLQDETIQQGTTRGISNEMTSPVADVRLRSGVLLAVLPSQPNLR